MTRPVSLVLAVLCLVDVAGSASRALAQEPRVGQVFMPKMEVRYRRGDKQVDEEEIDLPLGHTQLRNKDAHADWLWVGRAYVHVDDVLPLAESVDYYSEIIDADDGEMSARAYFLRGVARSALMKSLDDAHADLTKAIELDPELTRALVARALNNVRRMKTLEAVQDLDAVVAKASDDRYILKASGLIRWSIGQVDGAITDFTKVIEIAPDVEAYGQRGRAYRFKKDFDAALRDADKMIELDPASGLGQYERGVTRYEQGKFDDALRDFEEALPLAPPKSPLKSRIYGTKGIIYRQQGKIDLALHDLNRAIRIDPHSTTLAIRAQIRTADGDYERALADCEESIRLWPKNVSSHNLRAWILATCPDEAWRDGKQAIESALTAYELSQGKVGAIMDTLAAAYAETGDFEKAVETQQKAIELLGKEDEATKATYEKNLELYRSGKPYRDKPVN